MMFMCHLVDAFCQIELHMTLMASKTKYWCHAGNDASDNDEGGGQWKNWNLFCTHQSNGQGE